MALDIGFDIYAKNSQDEILEGDINHFIGLVSNISESESRSSIEETLWDKHFISYSDFISYVIFHCNKNDAKNFRNFIRFYSSTMNTKGYCLGSYFLHFDGAVNDLLFSELDEQLEHMVDLMKESEIKQRKNKVLEKLAK